MKSVLSSLQSIQEWVLDILFPEKCLVCKRKGTILCAWCISSFCQSERRTDNDIYAYFDYRDPTLKKAIWNLKYYKRHTLGQILGNLVASHYKTLIDEMYLSSVSKRLIVIPVPLSHNKKRKRGYNQAERIAQGFCESLIGTDTILEKNIIFKNKNTVPQARIHRKEDRLANIAGAFSIKNRGRIVGQTVIVIDDVTTTGGTLREILELIRKEGAAKAVGFAVAH